MSAALKTPRIRVFTLDGVFQRAFGTSGQAIGEPGHPMNLTIHGGELYVAEYFNDHIQGFDVPDRDHSMREASWFPPVPATPHAAQGPLV